MNLKDNKRNYSNLESKVTQTEAKPSKRKLLTMKEKTLQIRFSTLRWNSIKMKE